MSLKSNAKDFMPAELRELVGWSVALLGQVIEKEAGHKQFQFVESMRKEMVQLREDDQAGKLFHLQNLFEKLRKFPAPERHELARSFTLLLELTNACENAYRSFRLAIHEKSAARASRNGSEAIVYVLTAHPTEARSGQNISIFRSIQTTLLHTLENFSSKEMLEKKLFHELELAWRISIVRERAPKVKDEAEHIYSLLFQEDIFASLLDASAEIAPVYIRTWVGGDKDGHPGVDEQIMQESLQLSRAYFLRFVRKNLASARDTLALLPSRPLKSEISKLSRCLAGLKTIRAGDGARVCKFREALHELILAYAKQIGSAHPELKRIKSGLHLFPGMVVPLELRESSEVLMADSKGKNHLAIDRMLALIGRIAQGGDPKWYARGLIVSMASSIEHLLAAEAKVRAALGECKIPVIPLFEELDSLERSVGIIEEMAKDPRIAKDIAKLWGGTIEIMMGYSDSSKESGVLPSRLAIAHAMHRLDALATRRKMRLIFFQGSGGSIDRGGGSVQDQTRWWPKSALRVYKVTVQGEMIERSLASPEITRGQIRRISESTQQALAETAVPPPGECLVKFAAQVSRAYQSLIEMPEFIEVVERATPYPDLSALKFGSRPSRRAAALSVKGLRAIPWVLCWTQTRVLLQTWWGVGSAWQNCDNAARAQLQESFRKDPVFASFVKALGFTLAKVEIPIWKIYLRQSGLHSNIAEKFENIFEKEFQLAVEFFRSVSGENEFLWFRPWLGASIRLRAPMIHPLNLLQILALQERDLHLLRYTVTGIASGMLTTG